MTEPADGAAASAAERGLQRSLGLKEAVSEGCHAVLPAKPTYRLERILVALRLGPLATRITHLLVDLLADTEYRATLLYVVEDDREEEPEGEDPRSELELLKRELVEREGIDARRSRRSGTRCSATSPGGSPTRPRRR